MAVGYIFQIAMELWTGIFCVFFAVIDWKTVKHSDERIRSQWRMLLFGAALILFDSAVYFLRFSNFIFPVIDKKICVFAVFFLQQMIFH